MTPHKRVLVAGGMAGGASCAAPLRRLDEHADIAVFECAPHGSLGSCGLPSRTGIRRPR
jgi:NADPH-dependent 2,4-dienoyl-CoA reductase/sulfur reductase-like enzyme